MNFSHKANVILLSWKDQSGSCEIEFSAMNTIMEHFSKLMDKILRIEIRRKCAGCQTKDDLTTKIHTYFGSERIYSRVNLSCSEKLFQFICTHVHSNLLIVLQAFGNKSTIHRREVK